MIVDIIPTKKMPKNLSILSYQVPSSLKKQINIGQLINIPLKNSNIIGVVNSTYRHKHFPYPLKNINNIIHPKPIFTINQLKLFNTLAQYYQISSSLFVHYNLPQLIKKDWNKLPLIINNPPQKNKTKITFFWWASFKQKQKKYLNYIARARKKNKQILFVVPQITDIQKLIDELKITTSNITIIHHKKNRQGNIKNWFQAINPGSRIFIGTRSALFYPYINLDTIIIDDEHSVNHKQTDMNPRYETKIVAQHIACQQIILSSNSPTVESYYNFKLTPPNYNKKNIHIINNTNVLANKNYTFISDNLTNKIQLNLKQKKSIFLFINRKGEARTTTCLDCGYTFNCPHCKLPLIKTDNKLICYHCGHIEDIPPFCPHCAGPNFKSTGLGIQKIKTTINKLFPEATTIILDKQHSNKIAKQKTAIYIGTEFALDKINWSTINLIGIINADQLWHHIEYNSAEQAYALLIKILTLSHKNATIIIQTFNPNHYIIKSLVKNNPLLFYKQELLLRKQFAYPPYINIIKLSYLNLNQKKAEQTANKLYQKLILAKTKININSPIQILHNKTRNKYKYNIILKLNNLNDFNPLVKLIPHNWLIDIHPWTLLN